MLPEYFEMLPLLTVQRWFSKQGDIISFQKKLKKKWSDLDKNRCKVEN